MIRLGSYPIVRIFTSILVALFFAGSVSAQTAPAPAAGKPKGIVVGFLDVKGNTIFLHDFKGRPIVLALWASWCAPCVREMPSLAKLQQAYRSRGLTVLAISEDDSFAEALRFYKTHGITSLAPLFDSNHAVWLAVQGKGVPVTILINRNGEAVKRIQGPADWQSSVVQQYVDQLVK